MLAKDLKKAYYKIPVAKEAQPYFCFEWCGTYFMSMVLLFGFCLTPFYFTKVCRPIARWFGGGEETDHKLYRRLVVENKEKVSELVDTLFRALGWTVSPKD